MKATDIQIELRNYKIREGYLYKRSRIMREWRKRWIVLTMNFLFSFQTEKCGKPTQVIDLKEVVNLRSVLRRNEDSHWGCFYVQTKSTDFAIAATDMTEKWSWMVSFQRLFDFKEKGPSPYNNIDYIRTEGFQSQNQFQYRRIHNIKNVTTVKKLEKQCKEKQQKADQILQKLLQQQIKLNLKEEQLLKLEKKLQKEQIFLSERKQSLQLQLQIQSNKRKSNISLSSLKSNTQGKDQNSLSLLQEAPKQIQLSFQLTQTMKFIRSKCIQYIFDEFHAVQMSHCRQELPVILQFLLKIAEKESYQFRPMLSYEIHNHKYLKNFIKYLLYYAQKFVSKDFQEIKRLFIIFKMMFAQKNNYMQSFGETALELVCRWVSHFTSQTETQILSQAVETIKELICFRKNNLRSKLLEKLTYLRELSSEAEQKLKCQQILNGLKE